MNNSCYILARECGKIVAYSEQALNDILPFFNRCSAPEDGPSLPSRDSHMSIAEKYYRVTVCQLKPDYTLYNFNQVDDRKEPGADLLTISCAEINHKLRNPLTSIKLVVDMLPLYLSDSSFKDEALKIFNKQLNNLEAYTRQLEERVGGGHGE